MKKINTLKKISKFVSVVELEEDNIQTGVRICYNKEDFILALSDIKKNGKVETLGFEEVINRVEKGEFETITRDQAVCIK